MTAPEPVAFMTEEIARLRAALVESQRRFMYVDSENATLRWLATLDSLTARLDAAERERDAMREALAKRHDYEAATWQRIVEANPCVVCKDPSRNPFDGKDREDEDFLEDLTTEELRDAAFCLVNKNRVEWHRREATALRGKE